LKATLSTLLSKLEQAQFTLLKTIAIANMAARSSTYNVFIVQSVEKFSA